MWLLFAVASMNATVAVRRGDDDGIGSHERAEGEPR